MDFRERMRKANAQGQERVAFEVEETRKVEARFPALKLKLLVIMKECAQDGGYEFSFYESTILGAKIDEFRLSAINRPWFLELSISRRQFACGAPEKERITFKSEWERRKKGANKYHQVLVYRL